MHHHGHNITAACCRGLLVPVLPAYTSALVHLRKFLQNKQALRDIVLILDEADNMWTNRPSVDKVNNREDEMYRLLCSRLQPDDPSKAWLTEDVLKRCRFRSYVQVSATHLTTVTWHAFMNLPFKALIADPDVLQKGGYFQHTDFVIKEPPPGGFHAPLCLGWQCVDHLQHRSSHVFGPEFETTADNGQSPGTRKTILLVCLLKVSLVLSLPALVTQVVEMLDSFNRETSDADRARKLLEALNNPETDEMTKHTLRQEYTSAMQHYKKLGCEHLLAQGPRGFKFPEPGRQLLIRTECKRVVHNGRNEWQRNGRLMQICITARIGFSEGAASSFNNLKGVPDKVFHHVPNAVCLVVTGRGVLSLSSFQISSWAWAKTR